RAARQNAGCTGRRIVRGEWTRTAGPGEPRLDGEVPQMLFVSSMQIHSQSAYELIADAHKLGDNRPFIVAGGAKAIYEPWDFFGFQVEGQTYSADVVVTGEEFVLLELLDRIMAHKGRGEHPRKTFHRLRRSGLLDDIPGLVFRPASDEDKETRRREEHLINTGIQRMVQDLDELPHPLVGLALLEPPHRRHTLSSRPLALTKLKRHASVVA